MSIVYSKVKEFKKKYPLTLTWFRLKKHCKIVEMHVNPDEVVTYAFAAQKNKSAFDIFQTCVVALTNKRILVGQKRVTWGQYYSAITPDMFNDLKITEGIIWGYVEIDTIKEVLMLSNLDRKSLVEIETVISSFMMEEKKKMHIEHNKNNKSS